jgi:arsenate reductase
MTLYGLKNCDTCRKAVKAMDGMTLVDVRAEPLSDAVLDRALAQFGADLVNRRSTTWRNLGDDERARPERDLLRDHPSLMKRPLIEAGDTLYRGWTKATQDALGVKG